MKTQNITKIYILMLLVPFFWGGAFGPIKHALVDMPPITLCAVRFTIAAVLMVIWAVWQKLWDFDAIRKNFFSLAVIGFAGIWGFNIFTALGTMYTSAINASLVIVTHPTLTALLAILFFGETCTKQTILGLTLSIIGVVLSVSQSGSAALLKLSFGIGEFYLVLAVFCWSGYTLLIKNVVGKKKLDSTLITAAATVLGTIMLLFTAVIMDSSWLKNFSTASISAQTGWEIICLSVFATFVAFILYSWGVKSIGATKASAYVNLMPINAIWVAVLLYGETVSVNQIIGMFITITGVFLTTTNKLNRSAV